ncbi:MAG: hypothetical protein M1839_000994 [Geoglossum umbratile]|nr:MAG: hypothetical protein M1839_000994 [Geoglossum umbratile]
MEHHRRFSTRVEDSSETQDPTALVPQPPARNVADDSMGRQYHPPSQCFPLVEGVTYTRQAPVAPCNDAQNVPILSLFEPPGFQASPFIGEIDDSSPTGNLVSWPVIFPSPLAGTGCTQVVTGIISNDMGEVGRGAPPGLGPQRSVTSGFIDIAGSDTSPCGRTLLSLPQNGVMTDAAIPQSCCAPAENQPRQVVEISLDEGVRLEGGPKLCQKTGKKRIPPLPDPQGTRRSKIKKNVSKKSPKMRALSKCIIGESHDGPCKGCLLARPYILKMPCMRATIIDAALFRLRPPEDDPPRNWTRREDVYALKDNKALLARPRQIQLTQDMGVELTVSVATFTPEPDDKTAYEWEDSRGVHTMEMPHFFIVQYGEAMDNMMKYVEDSRQHYLDNLLDSSDKILWDTFQMAIDMGHMGNSPMLKGALSLWSAGRIIERFWRICSDDDLGIGVILDPTNPWSDTIPIPPIMDTQLDQLVIQGYLIPLKDQLLQELQAKINKKSKEDWFEIYLTVFVLLSNTEQMLAHTRRRAKCYGMSVCSFICFASHSTASIT